MTAAQYKRKVSADREAWRDEMPPRCMNCLKPFGYFRWPEIHEILSKAQAHNNWGFRANYLLLCNQCHLGDGAVQDWPHAKQLALKRRADPKHFDLQEWLRRRNPNAMEYVTEAEVAEALCQTPIYI